MFTGIVRERGRVVSCEDGRLVVETTIEASVGDSVAVNGVCLTVVGIHAGLVSFDVVPETLGRTAFGGLRPSVSVNVEPALRAGEPLGGHYVQGHVDGVGRIRSSEPEGSGRRLWIEAPPELLRYVVDKGSVTVDGVSLTVAGLDDSAFAVALVPHTLEATTLGGLEPGGQVNLEADILAKYVERLINVDTIMPNGQNSNSVAALDVNTQGDVLFQYSNGVNSMVVRRGGKLRQVHNFFQPTADGDWLIRINAMDLRNDGTVYKVAPNGTMSSYAEGMGIATGMAFDRDENLYVGDRSGTIFKIAREHGWRRKLIVKVAKPPEGQDQKGRQPGRHLER
jgi:riboflavin synthase